MATVAETGEFEAKKRDALSGIMRAHSIDRWIFVLMAVWFIVIVLVGFIPRSLSKVAAVQSGEAPPFPLVLHLHAIFMGSFLLLLVAQTSLVAIGRSDFHRQLGVAAALCALALVIVGFITVPTMYYQVLATLQTAPPETQDRLQDVLYRKENAFLLQARAGILFSILLGIGLLARRRDAGLHKRTMILATAMPLTAALARVDWLPTTMPTNPASLEIVVLVAIVPMFVWDVIRNRGVHRAYLICLIVLLPVTVALHGLWDTIWWHATVRQVLGI